MESLKWLWEWLTRLSYAILVLRSAQVFMFLWGFCWDIWQHRLCRHLDLKLPYVCQSWPLPPAVSCLWELRGKLAKGSTWQFSVTQLLKATLSLSFSLSLSLSLSFSLSIFHYVSICFCFSFSHTYALTHAFCSQLLVWCDFCSHVFGIVHHSRS